MKWTKEWKGINSATGKWLAGRIRMIKMGAGVSRWSFYPQSSEYKKKEFYKKIRQKKIFSGDIFGGKWRDSVGGLIFPFQTKI